MESIQLSQLWTVSTILFGFQATALAWRIKREIDMEKEREATWLTWADGFVALSFLVLVFGVFVFPLIGIVATNLAAKMFGFALVAFAASPFILAGHYNLYPFGTGERPRPNTTNQEKVAVIISAIFLALYFPTAYLWPLL